MKRKIITIDEDLCTGCGSCIPDCPEGALQLIDGKARLVSDLFCDGLGACIGSCPVGAITVEEREAEPYDEKKVMNNIIRQGPGVIRAHLEHLRSHGQEHLLREALACLEESGIGVPAGFLAHSSGPCDEGCRGGAPAGPAAACPGARPVDLAGDAQHSAKPGKSGGDMPSTGSNRPSRLRQWPVQIMLVPVEAPFFEEADLLFAADCVPFAFPEFHEELLKGRVCLVGCPKLDDAGHYLEKLTEIFRRNDIKSVMIAFMEVPCCSALVRIVEAAIAASGKNVPLAKQKIGIHGNII